MYPMLRRLVQLGFLLPVGYVAVGRQLGWGVPTIDAICPFGAIEGLYNLLVNGRYLGKLFPSNMVLGAAVLVAVLIAAGAFCGWICPFGFLQDGLGKLAKRLKIPPIKIPLVVEKRLRLLRFAALAGILWITIGTTELLFSQICPYRTIFSLDWLFNPSLSAWPAYAVAIFILVGSLFVHRFFCRFLCPLGAVIGVLAPLSIVKVRRQDALCTHCGLCRRVCPMNLTPDTGASQALNCTLCQQCTEHCPSPGALHVSSPRRWRTVLPGQSWAKPAAAVVGFVCVLLIAQFTGTWETSGQGAAYFHAIQNQERLHPEDIRGWMTLENVQVATGVPVEHLLDQLGLPNHWDPTIPLRELESTTHVETDDVRHVVAEYYKVFPKDYTWTAADHSSVTTRQRQTAAPNAGGEITGVSTLNDVLRVHNVPREDLLQLLQLADDTPLDQSLRSLGIELIRIQMLLGDGELQRRNLR